jgi:hypothetical protein
MSDLVSIRRGEKARPPMSTRSSGRLGGRVADSAPDYLNRGLQLAGLFFFVNGIYLAFFSETLATTVGYYFVVLAAAVAVLSRFVPGTHRRSILRSVESFPSFGDASTPSVTRTPSRRQGTGRDGTHLRRYTRAVRRTVQWVAALVRSANRSGRDRL